MSVIKITAFNGMTPRTDPRLIEPNVAQLAVNAKLQNGSIKPYKQPGQIAALPKTGTIKSIYRFGQDVVGDANYWFHWTTDVNVVKGPVAADDFERTYWTGDGPPKMTTNAIALLGGTNYPMNSYTLGLPAPASAITASTSDAATQLTIDSGEIPGLAVGDVFRITVNQGSPVNITLTAGSSGDVTAASLAAQIGAITGLDAVADEDDNVVVTVLGSSDETELLIEKKTGTASNYDTDVVTYTAFVNTISGTTKTGSPSITITSTMISGWVAGNRIRFTVDYNNPLAFALTGSPITATSVAAQINSQIAGVTATVSGSTVVVATSSSSAFSRITLERVYDTYSEELASDANELPAKHIFTGAEISGLTPDDRLEITVNNGAPIITRVFAGTNTFPAEVTAESLANALRFASGVNVVVNYGAT